MADRVDRTMSMADDSVTDYTVDIGVQHARCDTQRFIATDLRPSAICLGTGSFGISVENQCSWELMDRFVAAGGNFLDTALVYGEWLPDGKGRSEQTIGAWMTARA